MTSLVHLTPLDPRYPSRLRAFAGAPASLTIRGGDLEAPQVVAIVGSREATRPALDYARGLARDLASMGTVVISGGALGVDAAAHEGALAGGGRTWVMAATGHLHCYPRENAALFDAIAAGPGAMIWPFPADRAPHLTFLRRNGYLVEMSDAVVVIQAGSQSGAMSAAQCALRQGKPLWVVPDAPWSTGPLGGVRHLLDRGLELGVRPLTTTAAFFRWLALPPEKRSTGVAHGSNARLSLRKASNLEDAETVALLAPRPLNLSHYESVVLQAISTAPLHADVVTLKVGLSPQATAAALLTLALENVLVEGPPGFFRRRDAHNR